MSSIYHPGYIPDSKPFILLPYYFIFMHGQTDEWAESVKAIAYVKICLENMSVSMNRMKILPKKCSLFHDNEFTYQPVKFAFIFFYFIQQDHH